VLGGTDVGSDTKCVLSACALGRQYLRGRVVDSERGIGRDSANIKEDWKTAVGRGGRGTAGMWRLCVVW